MTIFATWPLLTEGKSPCCPLDTRSYGPHLRSGRRSKDESLPSHRVSNPDSLLVLPIHSHYTNWAIPVALCEENLQKYETSAWGVNGVEINILAARITTPWSLVDAYQHFGWICWLSLPPWKWRQHISLKLWYPPTRLHDVINRKTTI